MWRRLFFFDSERNFFLLEKFLTSKENDIIAFFQPYSLYPELHRKHQILWFTFSILFY